MSPTLVKQLSKDELLRIKAVEDALSILKQEARNPTVDFIEKLTNSIYKFYTDGEKL